jgi:hypothetical protein
MMQCPCPSGCATCGEVAVASLNARAMPGSKYSTNEASCSYELCGGGGSMRRNEQVCRHQLNSCAKCLRPVYPLSEYLGDTANEAAGFGPALKKHCCSPNHRVRQPTRLREPSQRHRLKGPLVESISLVVNAGQPTRALPNAELLNRKSFLVALKGYCVTPCL